MGRLFWKFFFVLLLAQIVSVLGVGMLIGLHNRESLSAKSRESRESHAELSLDRQARRPTQGPPPSRSGSGADDESSHSLRGLRRPHPEDDFYEEGDGPQPHSLIPRPPLLSGLAASLIFAALLAWYFAKPIRSLSRAFDAVAQGNLGVRLSAEMGGRRDELADLGRDFDGMAQRVQGLMDGQRRLFHDVSHELRSPLTRMQVAIGLARQQPERADEVLLRVERESVRMDQLVSELLTLARLESGLSVSVHEEIALGEFVGNIVDDSRVEADAKRCHLRFDDALRSDHASGDEAGICVRGNPEMLRRGVENVLRNAIRHSPPYGEIIVTIHTNAAGRAEVAIIDQGNGVPESMLQHIFQPFFRGADDGVAGGLGLAIAQRVVVMHDGSIRASNLDAGGFSVTIELPQIEGSKPGGEVA